VNVVALTLELHLPGCASLKEKRGRLKPLLAALHRQFNVSAAEIGRQDAHQAAVVACVVVSNSNRHGEQLLSGIPAWLERAQHGLQVVDHQLTVL
jgi:hypothetical protein